MANSETGSRFLPIPGAIFAAGLRIGVLLSLLWFAAGASAQILHEQSFAGDFYAYIPERTAEHILVVAHGKLAENDDASKLARKFLKRWIAYAEQYGLLVIAPVFDTPRFGNRGGGYGGYRNLFGRHVPADRFVNDLVDRFAERTRSRSNRFYLYGHSAGGQFANRYAVTHPDRIIRAVISAAGRYSYPTESVAWPYGAGDLSRNVKWRDGARTQLSVSRSLERYAEAATRVAIVIGERDTRPQPKRPAHRGTTRIDYAESWAGEMNKNAKRHGVRGRVRVHLIPGIGHDSAKLTPHCARVLFDPDNNQGSAPAEPLYLATAALPARNTGADRAGSLRGVR